MLYIADRRIVFGGRITRGVKAILIAMVSVYVVQIIVDGRADGLFTHLFGLRGSALLTGYIWQPFTYMFLHGGPLHLAVNALVFFVFGGRMEGTLGLRRFLVLYVVSGIVAALGWLVISPGPYPLVGASGSVYGVVGAFAAMYPHERVSLLFLPLVFTVRTLILVIAAASVIFLLAGSSNDNVAHAAHLAGGLAGYVYGIWVQRQSGGATGNRRRQSTGVMEWIDGRRADLQRRRLHVLDDEGQDEGVPTPQEVDTLLDKITEHGIGSLSRKERKQLDRASKGGTG